MLISRIPGLVMSKGKLSTLSTLMCIMLMKFSGFEETGRSSVMLVVMLVKFSPTLRRHGKASPLGVRGDDVVMTMLTK